VSSAWVRYVNMHVSRVTFTCTRTHEHVHKNKYLFQVYFGLFAHFMLIHPLLIYLCNWKNIVIKCLRSKKKKKSLHAQHNVSMSVCVCMCVRACVRASEQERVCVCLPFFLAPSHPVSIFPQTLSSFSPTWPFHQLLSLESSSHLPLHARSPPLPA